MDIPETAIETASKTGESGMHQRTKGRLTYANVMSTLGVFIALGGTAYAVNTVSSGDIVDGQVKTPDLANAAVLSAKLAADSVTTHKVLDGTLAGRDVLDNSLRGADIDESSLSVSGGAVGQPEAWRNVAAGSATVDRCDDPGVVAVFCSDPIGELEAYVWHNYGGAFSRVAFYEDQVGVVHLKGLAVFASGAHTDPTDAPIFRLPAAYRPEKRRVFPSVGSSFVNDAEIVQGRIDVQPNGLVTLVQSCGIDPIDDHQVDCSASGGDVTLDGITFRPGE